MLTILTPAKINLVLEVLGRRDDGYHEIRSLIQTVNLYDVISFELAERISLECNEPSLQSPDNLVIQAAELLKKVSGYDKGANIKLEKRIPWDAGLGGGSSDAATTLLSLNELWKLKIPTSELIKMAASLGSDVPFFIHQGTAVVEGRGEKVIPLPDSMPNWFVVLIPSLPKIARKTQQLYSSLGDQLFTKGQFSNKAIETWSQNRQLSPSLLFNVFDSIAFDVFSGISDYWRKFEEAGATNVHLAGSGPSLFSPVSSKAEAEELGLLLSQHGLEAYPVSTIITQIA